jgi:hypothetical protein
VVLSDMKSAIASILVLTVYIHAIKVSRIKICALRVVHPGNLVSGLWCLGARLYPLVKVCFQRSHLPIEF